VCILGVGYIDYFSVPQTTGAEPRASTSETSRGISCRHSCRKDVLCPAQLAHIYHLRRPKNQVNRVNRNRPPLLTEVQVS